LALRTETPRQSIDSHLDEISTGILSPSAEALFADHVVGGSILLPGVGYLEMMFNANLDRYSAFTDVAFMRPCWLPQPGANERCVLRYTRQSDAAFEVASWRGMESSVGSNFTTHFRAVLANIDIASETMSTQLSRADSFMKGMPKLSADEGSAVQVQNQNMHSQELLSSWTGSFDTMQSTGLIERRPS
jgi:hypothetical protein